MSAYLLVLPAGLAVYTGWQAWRIGRLMRVAEKLAAASLPFSRTVHQATLRILVVGDSSGLGIGASTAASSIAGLIGEKYTQANVVNVAVNGARTNDAVRQLQATPGTFDLIVVMVGGNDIVHFTPHEQLRRELGTVLALASRKAKHVLFSPTGNVGDVLLFPAPVRWILARRSRAIRRLFTEQVAAAAGDVRFADLYREGGADPFVVHPQRYFAADLFHPSDAGYADWFNVISSQLDHFRI